MGERVQPLPAELALRDRRTRSVFRYAVRLARRKPLGALAAAVILALIVMAIWAPQIAPRRYDKQDIAERLEAPSRHALFGTDDLGRDVISRIIYGSRISLTISVIAVALGVLHGGFWGIVSGFFGGKTDMIVQRVMDGFLAMPVLLFAMVVVMVLGPSITNVIAALVIATTAPVSRIVRSAVLSVKNLPYMEAARCVGVATGRMILRHVLPNVFAPLIVIATINLGAAIIAESSLSFLGMGVPPPYPSWGGMLSGPGRTYLTDAPWLAIFPGLAISITVLAFNMLGDAVRDVLDPRLRSA
jgi:ABC-type dipeptide/oligopeptide/nickel transport system permease subunit